MSSYQHLQNSNAKILYIFFSVEKLIESIAREVYSFELKRNQKQAVISLLEGKDVIVDCPTGFGKSVVFQLYLLVKGMSQILFRPTVVTSITFAI